jgi:glyoxylase-like metal-dependent hydrolase (beta-lactamase superfamily II)
MPQQVAADIYLVQVPIPVPLRTVNCYLVRGSNGWTIVDAGFHDEGAESAWQEAFRSLALSPGDVTGILVTHYHPDHYGAAGWLQHLTGAPAYMHGPEIPDVGRFWHSEGMGRELALFFAAHGMDRQTAAAIEEHHRMQQGRVEPAAELLPLAEGERILLGDRLFEVIWCPGHSDGLAVFWCEEEQILLANDLILPKITPNISLWPGGRPNPLQDFLESLERVRRLKARLVLTGHRQVLTDLPGRIAELRLHHEKRLAEMESYAAQGASGWEICRLAFDVGGYSIHQVRFAMGETLSHLEYLRQAGRLRFDGESYMPAR